MPGSKKYDLSKKEFLKGLLMAALVSALTLLQQAADSIIETGVYKVPDFKIIGMAAISGASIYLLKKFLTDNTGKI